MKDAAQTGWVTRTLGEVATVVNGGTPKSKVAEYWGGGVQWLTPKDMGQMQGREISETPRTITEAGLSGSSARLAPAGSVILSTRAPIGHLAINTVPMAFNQGCRGVVPSGDLDPVFLYHFLDMSRDLLNDLGTGTTFKELSSTNLKSVKIPLPPLEEQHRIVAVLDEAFEGLARARAHAETNLQNAQELFENILTHTLRHKFEQGKDKLLGDVCELAQGLAINKGTKHLLVEKSSKPLLRIKDLRNNTVEQYVAETGFPPKAAVTADDIIYTRTGQIGLVFRGFEGVLHNNCFSVRTLGDVSQEYLFWWLQEPVFRSEIISLASRAAQPDITHKLFKARSITFPKKDDQASAVELIESAFSETAKLQERYKNKIQDIDDLRQSLLQKAFAGELT